LSSSSLSGLVALDHCLLALAVVVCVVVVLVLVLGLGGSSSSSSSSAGGFSSTCRRILTEKTALRNVQFRWRDDVTGFLVTAFIVQ